MKSLAKPRTYEALKSGVGEAQDDHGMWPNPSNYEVWKYARHGSLVVGPQHAGQHEGMAGLPADVQRVIEDNTRNMALQRADNDA